MSRESFWLRRFGAWGILLLMLGLAYGLIAMPLMERHEELDRATKENIELLENFKRFSASGKSYEFQLESLETAQSASGFYLDGASLSHASAGLQEKVTTLIRRTGATIRSSETRAAEEGQELTRIGLRVQFTARIAELQKVIYAMETGVPLLFVEKLEIASRSGRTYLQIEREPMLSVRLDVSGYMRPGS
jgi:general secretion pathway protein M